MKALLHVAEFQRLPSISSAMQFALDDCEQPERHGSSPSNTIQTERDGDRQTETERQRYRDRQRQTYRNRQTNREAEIETETEAHIRMRRS